MSYIQSTVFGAIARSISHDETVTVQCGDIGAAYAELTADQRADDYVDTRSQDDAPLREVWGTTDDGDEWRVHLRAV